MRVHGDHDGYVIDLFQPNILSGLRSTFISVCKKQFFTDLIMAVDENGEAKQTEDCTS